MEKADHNDEAITPSVRNFRRCWHSQVHLGCFIKQTLCEALLIGRTAIPPCAPSSSWAIYCVLVDAMGCFVHLFLYCFHLHVFGNSCEKTNSFGAKLLSAKELKVDDVSCIMWNTCLTSQNSSFSSSESPNNLPKLKRHNCNTSFPIIQQHYPWAAEKWWDSVFLVTLACWELALEGTCLAKSCSCIYLASHSHVHLCAIYQRRENNHLLNVFFTFWYSLPARNQMTIRKCFVESWSP